MSIPFSAERHFGQAGFLLVEALAVLAISATILVGLTSILGLALRSGDQAASGAHRLEMDTRAISTLHREIRHLTRIRWSGAAKQSFVFAGGPDRIMFAQSVRKPGMLASTAVVVVQSVSNKLGSQLFRAEAKLLPGTASQQELNFEPTREFYNGPLIVSFAYLARAENGTETSVSTWPSGATLPSAIRIEMLNAATGQLSSSLRVSLLAEAEFGCAVPKVAFCSRVTPTDQLRKDEGSLPNGGDQPSREQQ